MTTTFKLSRALWTGIWMTLALCVVGLLFLLIPMQVSADEETARRGGGNALFRATIALSHATTISRLMSHLQFASGQGGQPEIIPLAQNNAGGNANGGAQGGSGGNGGDAAQGGLIRAGDAVSHAHALTILNTVVIRIGR